MECVELILAICSDFDFIWVKNLKVFSFEHAIVFISISVKKLASDSTYISETCIWQSILKLFLDHPWKRTKKWKEIYFVQCYWNKFQTFKFIYAHALVDVYRVPLIWHQPIIIYTKLYNTLIWIYYIYISDLSIDINFILINIKTVHIMSCMQYQEL